MEFVLLAVLLASQTPATAAAKIRADAEERVRADATDLLRTLCPEQCVLLSVLSKVEEQELVSSSDVAPGFEAPGARTVPVLRAVGATVLVDQRLPAAFRARVKTLIAQRLKGVGVPAAITVEQVAFPVRNPAYLEGQQQTPPVAAATPAGPPRMEDRLTEHAPLLAVAVLLGAVLLVLGGLFFLAARRPAEPQWTDLAPAPEETAAPPAAAPAPAPVEAFPIARARRLEKQLADERALRNAVLRQALSRGEHALVGRWLRELGDFLLEDLRGDSSLAPALSALAAEVGRPADEASRAAALQELEGRLLSARLARTSEADAFAFLEGASPEAFIAALRGSSAGAQEVALRLAPAHLRSAALRELPAAQRQEIALAWVRKPEVSAAYALAAADELRERLAQQHAGAGHATRALADLLDALSREEQDDLLERLQREGDPRASAGILTESALASAPSDLLASAVLSVPAARLVSYLGGAADGTREHVLAACPQKLRAEIEEELRLSSGSSRDDFFAARRELLSRLREETTRRGMDASDVKTRRPRAVPLS
jgi:flagellar motor switch protein FliG